MNNSDVIQIFKELKKNGLIHPDRKIKPSTKLKILNSCAFVAKHPSPLEPTIFQKIGLYFISDEFFIEYDVKKIEFIDETALKFSLLHEEAHMRFYSEKLDWDDKKIDKLPPYSVEVRRENEFKADKYAARIMLEYYPDVDPCDAMQKNYQAYQNCCEKNKICLVFRKVQKIFFKLSMGVEDYHPLYADRIKKIKEYCDEKSG